MMGAAAPARGCADLLASVERHLPAALADFRAREALHAAAAEVPADVATSLWLECRLASGEGRVDLSFRVPPERVGALAAEPAPADPLAARVAELARRWSRPGSALARGAAGLWLEHDLPAPGPLAVPSVFVHLASAAPEPDRSAAVAQALEALLGGAPPAGLASRLRGCLAAADGEARLLQVGVMLPRADDAVRLCFVFHDARRLPKLLARLGWSGAAAPREGPLGPAAAAVDRFGGTLMLHVDVAAGGILPAFGVDLRLEHRPRHEGGLAERRLLDGLVAAGVADPAKARALAGWPGARRLRSPGGAERVVVRRLSHLKLSLRPGTAPGAKAYLAVSSAPGRGTALSWNPDGGNEP